MHPPISVLVVANETAASPVLIDALRARSEQGPLRLTLVLPCHGPGRHARDLAQPRLEAALAAWRAAGLDVDGVVGDEDPAVAVHEAWDPRRYDEILVSTLPVTESRWLRCDLPSRLTRMTDANVSVVRAATPAAASR